MATSSTKEKEPPSDEDLKSMIRKFIPKVDLHTTGIKAFIKLLSKECQVDLKSKTDYIKEELSAAINELEEDSNSSNSSNNNNSEDEGVSSDEEQPKKKKRGAGKGLSVKKEISTALANFLGQGPEMARTDIVKGLWDYIKEHQLQNPENKREIILDSKMKAVFGCDKFTMFTMNKYVTAHVHPFKPVDLTPKVKSTTTTSRKSKTSSAAAGSATKKRKRGTNATADKKRKPKKPGLQPPYRLSDAMTAVVGKDILPRPQVVTALWNYIKKNELQNPNDKREILCDDKLKAIMGGNNKVTMFNMNRYITQHLLEKLDRSAYNHEEEEEGEEDVEENDSEEEE